MVFQKRRKYRRKGETGAEAVPFKKVEQNSSTSSKNYAATKCMQYETQCLKLSGTRERRYYTQGSWRTSCRGERGFGEEGALCSRMEKSEAALTPALLNV
ncbi:hypothetical protein SESBI_29207 [Sesbania bispinosa]|nr:hypothetical protein SESBI_29207 [Sesbania bispinosa]